MPNPPKPIEVKRRNGNPGRHPLPKSSALVALPMADGVPDPPVQFSTAGLDLWRNVWRAGAIWISPATDMRVVVEACEAADALAIATKRYHATTDPADGRMVVLFAKRLVEALSAIGFDPTSRSRLGVAEVKAMSKLEDLRVKRSKRETS